MKTKTLALLVLAGFLATRTHAESTNLIVNGGFEQPQVPLGSFSTFAPPATFLGWTPIADGVDILGTNYVQSAAGLQSVDLNNVTSGGVYQDVVTSTGEVYRLSFALGANTAAIGDPRTGPAVKRVRVQWGSNAVAELAHDVTGHSQASVGWRQFTFHVTGTGLDRLLFESLTPGWTGPAIDDVSLTPTTNAINAVEGLTIERAVQVCWPTMATRTYQVQWSLNPDSSIWTYWGLPIRGDGMTNCICDPLGTNPRRFYRILETE